MKLLVAVCLSICCSIAVVVNAKITAHIPKHRDCILTKGLTRNCWLPENRYAYDLLKGKCVKFIYRGCGGNKNRFRTKSECIAKCIIGDSSESWQSLASFQSPESETGISGGLNQKAAE